MQESIGSGHAESRKAMTQPQNHWTRDEELLERYVFERIGGDELSVLEKHMQDCQECRHAVERERRLVAGVKRFGRDELKKRLRDRVIESSVTSPSAHVVPDGGSQLSWQTIVSIAAVILILTGIGIYNYWSFMKPATNGSLHQRAETELKPEAVEIEKMKEGKKTDVSSQQSPQNAAAKSGATGLKDLDARREEPAGAPLGQEGAGAAREKQRPSFDDKRGTVDWVEGTLITESQVYDFGDARGAAPAAQQLSLSKNQAQRSAPETGVQRHVQMVRLDTLVQTFELAQKPRAALQGRRQAGRLPQQIPTAVTVGSSVTSLTLYVDQLFADSTLASAIVRPVSKDSIVIHIGNQEIGYKLRGGWTGRK